MELLEIDEVQATAILDLQLRRLAALERQRIIDEHAEIAAKIADFNDILAKPGRQRQIIRDELDEIVEKYGDERRTRIIPHDGDVVDGRPDRAGGRRRHDHPHRYAKRTKTDLYRAQRRGGKGVQGAELRTDDIVAHFFVSSTHDWILFFTNKGRVYRAKAYELPEANRNARGQHVANLLAFQPDETIAERHHDQELRGRAVPGAGHQARPGQEDRSSPTSTPTAPAASSPSTCARTTS